MPFLSADSIGPRLHHSPMRQIADAGAEITRAVAQAVPIEHPAEPDLAFLYGTILTDGGDGAATPSRNVCIFAGLSDRSQPDRQRASARGMALQVARPSGADRRATPVRELHRSGLHRQALREAAPVGPRKAVVVEVGGIAHVTGESRFRFDDNDPLREGFTLGQAL
jgi:trans-L-3-hydroxyproline dehydratase